MYIDKVWIKTIKVWIKTNLFLSNKPVRKFLSLLFLYNSHLVVVTEGSWHLLIGHVGSILLLSPKLSYFLLIVDTENSFFFVFPADVWFVRVFSQQLDDEIPEKSAILTWRYQKYQPKYFTRTCFLCPPVSFYTSYPHGEPPFSYPKPLLLLSLRQL